MAYEYEPATIKQSLEDVKSKKLVLPAIQRGFVWKKEQIEMLFDSLMQSFPFGTLMFWEMKEETRRQLSFYNFLTDATEFNDFQADNLNAPELPDNAQAVMDGQQRLTALNIGLRGSFAQRRKHARKNCATSYQPEYLYFNLLSRFYDTTENDYLGSHQKYEFKFRACEAIMEPVNGKLWFRVNEIFDLSDYRTYWREHGRGLFDGNNETPLMDYAEDRLRELHDLIHSKQIVWHRKISSDVDEADALEIFVRTNQAGTPLSKGDMIFSMAVTQWKEKDARKEIENLIIGLNDRTDSKRFTKDFILSAAIMIGPASATQSRKRLINPEIMQNMEKEWERLKKALYCVAQLLCDWGIATDKRLISVNALLPLVHYLFLINTPDNFEDATRYADDRRKMHDLLLLSLLKGSWSGGGNTLSDRIRKTLVQWAYPHDGNYASFPFARIKHSMSFSSRSSINFADEDIDTYLEAKHKDAKCFFILSVMQPDIYRNADHTDIDHIVPKKAFEKAKLRKSGYSDDEIAELQTQREEIPNLTLMSKAANRSKGKKTLIDWLSKNPTDAVLLKDHGLLGDIKNLPKEISEFSTWFQKRKERMRRLLKQRLAELTEA